MANYPHESPASTNLVVYRSHYPQPNDYCCFRESLLSLNSTNDSIHRPAHQLSNCVYSLNFKSEHSVITKRVIFNPNFFTAEAP
jgi:hypothetical protein